MRILVSLMLLFAAVFAFERSEAKAAASNAQNATLTAHARQLLLVRAEAWYSSTATLTRYTKTTDGDWQPVGEPIAVNVGRRGMAWGRGMHTIPETGPRKREGDNKSPAGAFTLDHAFGTDTALPAAAHGFPYKQSLPTTYCVEDTRSEFYNRIIDARDVKVPSWEKWSKLQRSDGLFDWGIVVRHNTESTDRGAGSCVFLHLWKGPRRPTAGCTAMNRNALEDVLRWLDPDARALLVQLPEPAYQQVKEAWGLP